MYHIFLKKLTGSFWLLGNPPAPTEEWESVTCRSFARLLAGVELELLVVQSHMAQKPVPRGEVGCACVAREVSLERGGMGERGCARRLGGWVWV